jgi:ADP-dependent NAD(P)H-hydrate dehydratase / NAD(P)H-hydrate epimerase
MTSRTGAETIDRAIALQLLPRRNEHSHKWGVGGVVIIGGAPGYIGAPALSAMGASRSGAGIVSLAIARSSVGVTATLVPEAVFLPLPETDSLHGVQKALELIAPQVGKSKAMVVGPGLSRDESATALLAGLFGETGQAPARKVGFGSRSADQNASSNTGIVGQAIPTVVDADALHWLSERESWWEKVAPFSLVLTPHVGELAALSIRHADHILEDPAAAARDAARAWNQTVVLKAGKAYVSDGNVVHTLAAGAPALATAGTGDVLSGSIAAFLAQGLNPVDASSLAIYAGTEAAVRLTQELSTLGVVASDLPEAIARVLAELETESAG